MKRVWRWAPGTPTSPPARPAVWPDALLGGEADGAAPSSSVDMPLAAAGSGGGGGGEQRLPACSALSRETKAGRACGECACVCAWPAAAASSPISDELMVAATKPPVLPVLQPVCAALPRAEAAPSAPRGGQGGGAGVCMHEPSERDALEPLVLLLESGGE